MHVDPVEEQATAGMPEANADAEQPVVARTRSLIAANEMLLSEIRERRRLVEQLQETADDLAEAQRVAKLGNWTFDLRTQQVTWSDQLYRIFEIDPVEFDGRYDAFLWRVHSDDRTLVLLTNERAKLEGSPFDIEYRITTPSRQVKFIREVGYAARDEAGNVIRLFGTAQDVTDRKQAVENLKQSERRLAKAQRVAHVGYWEQDFDTGSIIWSDEIYRILGLQPQDPIENFEARIHPEDRPVHTEAAARAQRGERYDLEYRVVRLNGEVRRVYSHGEPIRDGAGRVRGAFGTLQDVTELKRAEDALKATSGQLRELSARLRSAREEEGARIARELHDELGSMLTSLKLDLEAMRSEELRSASDGDRSRLHGRIDGMLQVVDHTIDTVRRISSDLRPSVLDDIGLVAAIRWQGKHFEAQTGIVCRCDCRPIDVDLNHQQATAIFRVFQEALTNVSRHAKATVVDVTLENEGDELVLTIRDNGQGITTEAKSDRLSLGLLGMQERIALVGGTIQITGVEGEGTVIAVRVVVAS